MWQRNPRPENGASTGRWYRWSRSADPGSDDHLGDDGAGHGGHICGLGQPSAAQPRELANTSTKLLQNGEVRAASSNYLVDQLYANVDVAGELKQRLPVALAQLAGPVGGRCGTLP
jgi:hypothetical protein